ncbi:methyltransferase [Mollisia scopiformis]|uniref:Methyltransferase n=1 Tax=Mollisia scopiformis TaxID=149040 RepID=A0A194X5N0_MOLSC|nr:methyltransferase [Mollisia scopiformis]KUJ15485.1 methyltransferase [Mollisia scopiformis]
MAPPEDLSVKAPIYFLSRNPIYETTKPYTLRYRPSEASQIPQTNVERELHELVFHDLRLAHGLEYETCGFQVVSLESEMKYEEYDDEEKVERFHGKEVGEAVRVALGARGVDVVDYVIRRRDPSWPIATGETYRSQQPASAAHIDHTYEEGCRIVRDIYGEKADVVLQGRWQCVNVWHPLQGPLVDWPLAVCDASTVDFDNDTMAGDVVDREAVFENTQVHFNFDQKWYYLPYQLPSELLIFKNADSEEKDGSTQGSPHASFDNPRTTDADLRRESVEFRILVRW